MNRLSPVEKAPVAVPVFDIVNCGPRNRFVANGKLVCNSGGDRLNPQNFGRGSELRRCIVAPKGQRLVVVDSGQIEARTLAWLAGQQDLLDTFAAYDAGTGPDPYRALAAEIYGKLVEEIDKTERFVGKVCLAEGSLVLSSRGWIPIETLRSTDKLWDGDTWVDHEGLIQNGLKETLSLCGLWLTPDHLVWSGTQWLEARHLERDGDTLSQALAFGAANLPSQGTSRVSAAELSLSSSDATAGSLNTRSTTIISETSKVHAALYARGMQVLGNVIGRIYTRFLTTAIGRGYSTDCQLQSLAAITPTMKLSLTMADAESMFTRNGVAIVRPSSNTFRLWKVGMIQLYRWIGSITDAGTNRGISGSLLEKKMSPIAEYSPTSRRKTAVYDIACVGPRNRFFAWSERGPLVVHNCRLGLGYGMGAPKLQYTLAAGAMGPPVDLPAIECKRAVNVYRTRNRQIVLLWELLGKILIAMLAGKTVQYRDLLTFYPDSVALPNGLSLHYPELNAVWTERGPSDFTYRSSKRGHRSKIYGGLFTENLVQALARNIVAEQALHIATKYRVVLLVHDEVVLSVPTREAKRAHDFAIEQMTIAPAWCTGIPLSAEGGVGLNYGDAKPA